MLRNNTERRAYLENINNWDVVDEYDKKFRILKLKGLPLYMIEHYFVHRHLGNGWKNIATTSQYFKEYEENGMIGINCFVSTYEAVEMIKQKPER